MKWNEFIESIDFEKLQSIKKGVKDENMEEGLKVRKFLKEFFENLKKENEFLKNYNISANQAPTQQFWTEGNGIRVGFYKGTSYKNATQINLTIGASWGGGVFIKDNENLIFGNKKLLNNLKNNYPNFSFEENDKSIWAISFENNLNELPKEEDILIAIKNLSEIFEIMIKANKMKEKTNILKHQHQIILQGPPGTGKTRLAKQIAIKMIDTNLAIDTNEDIKSSLSEINKEQIQIKLIQFHPSYSYEDFVRGIVAKANGSHIEYKSRR